MGIGSSLGEKLGFDIGAKLGGNAINGVRVDNPPLNSGTQPYTNFTTNGVDAWSGEVPSPAANVTAGSELTGGFSASKQYRVMFKARVTGTGGSFGARITISINSGTLYSFTPIPNDGIIYIYDEIISGVDSATAFLIMNPNVTRVSGDLIEVWDVKIYELA